mgnify:CR=1 FL=1|jgi:hypothetical protein
MPFVFEEQFSLCAILMRKFKIINHSPHTLLSGIDKSKRRGFLEALWLLLSSLATQYSNQKRFVVMLTMGV